MFLLLIPSECVILNQVKNIFGTRTFFFDPWLTPNKNKNACMTNNAVVQHFKCLFYVCRTPQGVYKERELIGKSHVVTQKLAAKSCSSIFKFHHDKVDVSHP